MHVMTADEDEPATMGTATASQASHITISSTQSSEDMPAPVEQQHRAAAAAGSKRHRIMLLQDEEGMVSSSKYPKLETAKQVFEPQEGQNASSSSDEFLDDPSDTAKENQEENGHPTKEPPDNSFEEGVQLHSEDTAAVGLDSDAESVAISPQREILNDDLISAIEDKESSEAIKKLMSVSTALRIQNHISHTSQFVSNNYLENNNINSIADLETTIKQSNSQPFSPCDESSNELVNVISIPETSSLTESHEEYLHQEGSDQTEAYSNNENVTEKEADLLNLAPRGLYAVSTQSLTQSNLKRENSSSQDFNSPLSQNICQVQIDEEQSIRNQLYPHMSQIQVIDHQIPSTSRGFEENSCGMSRASSVSDLNLAHLVLSLKSDIQKLTEKVDKQDVMLDAVVRANQVNLAPMFSRTFQEKYDLKVPFTNLEDFKKFNTDLETNEKFCNEFTISLTGFIDNEVSLGKNVLNMVRQYMSKDLALLYNASKPAPNKYILKDTMFCKCLLQAAKIGVKDGKLPLEKEKNFMKQLGHVISGARGWHNPNEE